MIFTSIIITPFSKSASYKMALREIPYHMAKAPPFDIKEYLHLVRSFHGHVAPGVVVGGFMVNLAREHLREGTLFNAICETSVCLADAIQLLTPCTIGNGWVKIINLGRFALSLYDKDHGNGVRVFLDPKTLDKWPEIRSWFFKIKPKAEQDMELLIAQIKEAGETLCGIHPVQVRPELLKKQKRGEIVICPRCQEAYPARDGKICRGCQGESPYLLTEASQPHILTIKAAKSHGAY
jgi:formylmethanofuran dehydrogenase subunit E